MLWVFNKTETLLNVRFGETNLEGELQMGTALGLFRMMRDDTDRNDNDDDGNNNNNNNNNNNMLHFKCTSISALHHLFNPRTLGQIDYFLFSVTFRSIFTTILHSLLQHFVLFSFGFHIYVLYSIQMYVIFFKSVILLQSTEQRHAPLMFPLHIVLLCRV